MNQSLKRLGLLCAILAVAALTGCREITTTTRVFSDGSCERTIDVTGDSVTVDSVFTGPFPMPVDSTWRITQRVDSTQKTTQVKAGKKTEKNDKRTIVATKRFPHVADLNRLYPKKGRDSLKVRVDVRLGRRFRWFNTFIEYRETYKACTPFRRVPITDFLSPRELSLYYLKEDTLKLDKKVEQWLARSYFEELFHAMLQAADSIPIPDLDAGVLHKSRETLFTALLNLDNQKSGGEMFDGQKILKFLEGFYRNKNIGKWSLNIDKAMKAIEKKQEFLMNLDSDSYVNRVVMPGLILDTNAPSVEGNTVEWKLKSNRFYWEDYVMRVESRVVNRWAIWVTAALLLAVLAALAVLVIRRK